MKTNTINTHHSMFSTSNIFEMSKNSGGDTYFIIHPVLKHIAVLSGEVDQLKGIECDFN